MKINETDFADNLGKKMKWKHFKAAYSKVNLGISLEEAYKKLGGTVPEEKAEKPKPDKEKKQDSK